MRDGNIADIQPCVVVDDGVISASDLVSLLMHVVNAYNDAKKTNVNNAIDTQEINVKLSFQASNNNSVLNATLNIKNIEKVAGEINSKSPKQSDAEILQLCGKNVEFWQDYGIAKNGEFTNLPTGSTKFKLANTTLHKFFNVHRINKYSKKEEIQDVIGLYKDEHNYNQWVCSEAYDGSRKIESFQDGVISYNDEDSLDISDFVFVAGKSGGANSAGQDGGIYRRGEITALIKQENKGGDVDNVSNICEFLGSRMFAHAKPNSGAKVFLAKNSSSIKIPDSDGSNIYVASIFFDHYKDLYVDAYDILGKQAPKDRPWLIGQDASVFNQTVTSKNYSGFSDIMPLSLLIGDFDIHWGNVGVVRDPSKPDVPAKMVRIDFAWAFKGGFEDEVHPHSVFRHLPGFGPTNHFVEYPEEMRINPTFVRGLKDIYDFDFTIAIKEGFDEVGQYYGIAPLQEFAKQVATIEIAKINDKEGIVESLKTHFIEKMQKRQTSLKDYATTIDISLAFNKNEKGSWTLIGYQDDHGNRRTVEDIIRENPEYFKRILTTGGKVSLKRDEQKSFGGLIGMLDVFGIYRKINESKCTKQLFAYKDLIDTEIKRKKILINEKDSFSLEKENVVSKQNAQEIKDQQELKHEKRNVEIIPSAQEITNQQDSRSKKENVQSTRNTQDTKNEQNSQNIKENTESTQSAQKVNDDAQDLKQKAHVEAVQSTQMSGNKFADRVGQQASNNKTVQFKH
ncbi:MAG: hypothetical protein ACRY3E_05410 [Candidatus Lariskella arthropodorum]